MGRITASVQVASYENLDKTVQVEALVYTGAMYLTLPMAWKERFGLFGDTHEQSCVLADGREVMGLVAGPVRLQIDGFHNIYTSVSFVDMKPDANGKYEPLLGCIPLEESLAGIDMKAHRLFKMEAVSLKGFQITASERSINELRAKQAKTPE